MRWLLIGGAITLTGISAAAIPVVLWFREQSRPVVWPEIVGPIPDGLKPDDRYKGPITR